MPCIQRNAIFTYDRRVEVRLLSVDLLLYKTQVEFCVSKEIVEQA